MSITGRNQPESVSCIEWAHTQHLQLNSHLAFANGIVPLRSLREFPSQEAGGGKL